MKPDSDREVLRRKKQIAIRRNAVPKSQTNTQFAITMDTLNKGRQGFE